MNDVVHMRYELIRTYNSSGFNGTLKQFTIDELDKIISGKTDLTAFIKMQEKIEIGMDTFIT